MAIFEPIPYNNIFKDCIYDELSPQNNSATAYHYTFYKGKMTGSVIDFNDCYFFAKIKIQYHNADVHVDSKFHILPRPLQLWWSQMSAEIEGVLL